MKVLVTGGTGLVGAATVDALRAGGHSVRLLSRHAEQDARRWPPGVETWDGDVTSDAGVQGAADGCDAVVHAIGIVSERPGATFQAVNVDGTRRIAREAKRAGVRRFVYVSSLGAERGQSAYHRSKRDAERVVLEEDPPGWVIVRPGNVYGPGDAVISLLLRLVRTLPAIPTVGWGDHPFQPLWHEDAGQALARAATRTTPARTALDVAGPEVTTMARVVDLLSELTHTRTTRIPVPEPLARIGLQMAGVMGIELPFTEDQLTMLVEENVILEGGVNALTAVLGVVPTGLRDGVCRLIEQLPAQLPADGHGAMHRERFWADVVDARLTPEALMRLVRERFAELPPAALLTVGPEEDGPVALDLGRTLTLGIPLRGHVQVRVVEATDQAVTLVTAQGHFLAGAVRFLARPAGGEEGSEGRLRFEVCSYSRAGSTPDLIAMSMGGALAQAVNWSGVVEAAVRRSGGAARDGVCHESNVLDERDAARVEQWVEELVLRLQREEAGGGREQGTGNRE